MADDAELRYSVLGTLAVERGGRPVDIGHAKQRAVLALLLANVNRPLTADQIIDDLWGERPPPSVSTTLQAYVSNLRRALEPDRAPRSSATVLETTGGGYRLRADPDAIDALRFGALLNEARPDLERAPHRARGRLVEALALWRGPAYADFRYEEFARPEIERLEDLRVTALELRIAADLALGASSELVTELDALVREHPLRERLRAQQMMALYRAGRQTEALAVYRDVSTVLRDELGLEPGQELRDLQLAILEHDPRLRPERWTGSAGDDARHPAPDMVGRGAERAQLDAALNRAHAGRGSVVLVQGEAGIGKTRLLERFQHDARASGGTTAFARCVEVGGTPPFWPWTQLVRQLDPAAVVEAAAGERAHLAPLLPHEPDPASGPGAPLHRVADAVVATLRKLSEAAPVVLIFDDLYSADPDSLALLTLVASGLDELPCVVVGSHRGLDLGPDHPLSEALATLMRFDWVERIDMGPFAASEVAALVRQVTGGEVEDAVADAIHDRTNGNALFAIELTKLLHSQDRLDATGAIHAVPGSIRDVVTSRVGQLSSTAVRLLRAGSVAGREFALRDVAAVLGLDLDATIDAVSEATTAGLLRETDRAGTFRFSHVIVVDAVLDSLGSLRRAQLHVALADALEAQPDHATDAAVDVAHHRVEAIPLAGHGPAIEAVARAGRHAMASDALGLAERLFEQRRSLVEELPDSTARTRLEIDALLDLVRVLTAREGYHSQRIGEATIRLWDLTGLRRGAPELAAGAPIVSDDPVLSTLQARFSYVMVRSDLAEAAVVVNRFLELAESHPDPMVVLGANVAATALWAHTPRPADAVRAAERAAESLAVLDPHGSNVVLLPLAQQAARVTHHGFAAWAYYLAGDRRQAAAELAIARGWCDRLGHGFTTGFCVAVGGIIGVMDGDPDAVAEVVEWGRAAIDEGQFGLFDVWHDLLLTWADGMRDGDPAAAARRFREHLDTLTEHGALIVHTLYWAMTATLEQRAGDTAGMLDAARRGLDHADRYGERFWYPELERLAGAAYRALDRPEEGRAAQERAAAAARELGILPLVERLATSAAR